MNSNIVITDLLNTKKQLINKSTSNNINNKFEVPKNNIELDDVKDKINLILQKLDNLQIGGTNSQNIKYIEKDIIKDIKELEDKYIPEINVLSIGKKELNLDSSFSNNDISNTVNSLKELLKGK